MSDLTKFRDYCRKQAEADHRSDCKGSKPTPPAWAMAPDLSSMVLVRFPAAPACSGCITDAERREFGRLADEVDAYLSHEDDEPMLPTEDDVPLFEESR